MTFYETEKKTEAAIMVWTEDGRNQGWAKKMIKYVQNSSRL